MANLLCADAAKDNMFQITVSRTTTNGSVLASFDSIGSQFTQYFHKNWALRGTGGSSGFIYYNHSAGSLTSGILDYSGTAVFTNLNDDPVTVSFKIYVEGQIDKPGLNTTVKIKQLQSVNHIIPAGVSTAISLSIQDEPFSGIDLFLFAFQTANASGNLPADITLNMLWKSNS